jgi:hypothetical protein
LRPTQEKIIAAIEKVAEALAELKEEVAVVGGAAVVGLYADDPGAADVRPTNDIDLVFEIATYGELGKLEEKLTAKGFKRIIGDPVICRFSLGDLLVDVMATKEVGWAPANPWFEPGFKHLLTYELVHTKIKILSFDYFLATKFSAFHSRGNYPRISHDFEDIVYLLDNRLDLIRDIANSTGNVKKYLLNEFRTLIDKSDFHEAIFGHLEPGTQSERFKLLMDKLNKIVK